MFEIQCILDIRVYLVYFIPGFHFRYSPTHALCRTNGRLSDALSSQMNDTYISVLYASKKKVQSMEYSELFFKCDEYECEVNIGFVNSIII